MVALLGICFFVCFLGQILSEASAGSEATWDCSSGVQRTMQCQRLNPGCLHAKHFSGPLEIFLRSLSSTVSLLSFKSICLSSLPPSFCFYFLCLIALGRPPNTSDKIKYPCQVSHLVLGRVEFSGLAPDSELRYYSWWCSRDHRKCQGLNPGWLYTRPYPL